MSSDDENDEVEYEPETFEIGPYMFQITTVSFMPITALMKLQSEKKEISGQKLWCGSLGVIEYILSNPEYVLNKKVIELGAGTGLVGMVSKKLGADEVILTDYDKKSLDHMIVDCTRNGIEASVVCLNWFEYDKSSLTFEGTDYVRILAGDVLYKSTLISPFFEISRELLGNKKSKMLLCHVPRAGVEHTDVVAGAESVSLSIRAIPSELWLKGVCTQHAPADDYTRAQLYEIFL